MKIQRLFLVLGKTMFLKNVFFRSTLICCFMGFSSISNSSHDSEVDGEILELRRQLIIATKAEPDVVTWVRQQLKDSGILENGIPSLFPPEEILKKGEGPLSSLIQSLSNNEFPFDFALQQQLKTYYQGYLYQYIVSTPKQRSSLLEPKVIIQSESMGPYRITQEMAYQILSTNTYGDIVRGGHGGSHPVSRQGEVFFKRAVMYEDASLGNQLPLQPAMEAGMYHAYRLLFGEGYLAPTSFLTFNNVRHQTVDLENSIGLTPRQKETIISNTQVYGLGSYLAALSEETRTNITFKPSVSNYVAQGALAITGTTLLDYVRTQKSLPPLDSRSYSAHVLGSYIFPTQDAKFDNFMVVEDQENHTQKLIGIDNDLALGPVLKEGSQELNLKNGLYLCEIEMEKSIDPSLRHFMTQTPPDLFLIHWLKALDTLHHRYETLYKHGMISEKDYRFNEFPFTLSAHQLLQVGRNLLTVQSLFKESFYGQRITHQQLLQTLYPEINQFYLARQEQIRRMDPWHPPLENPPIIDVQFMEIFGEARPEIPLPAQKSKEMISLNSPFMKDGKDKKNPVSEAVQEVISEIILSHKRKDWGEVLETLADAFPDQAKPLLLSIGEGREDFMIHHPEFILKIIKEGRRASALKLIIELGFEPKTMPFLVQEVIHHIPESKGVAWLEALHTEGMSLEKRDQEHRETPLDLAMRLNKHLYVSWLIGHGAGHKISLSKTMDYLKALSPEEREHFEGVLPTLEIRNARLRWELIMDTFLPHRNTHTRLEGTDVLTTHNRRVLQPEFMSQLWKNPQSLQVFKKRNTYGRRNVGVLEQGRYKMYVKEHPELPGTEEAVGILTRMLLGHGTPHTLLGRIGNTAYLFCEGIEGDNLQDYFTGPLKWDDLKERLDEQAFGEMALVAMLTYPEDGKPDNFIVQKQEDGRYRLTSIDNDHAFVPSVAPSRLFQKRTDRVQVKSVLFTMDQMTQPLYPKIKYQFLHHNPKEVLEKWIQNLSGIQMAYKELFSREEVHPYFKEKGSFIGVGIHPNTIHKLYRDLVDLQYLIEKTSGLTPLKVMEQFNKPLYDRYSQGFSHPRLSGLNPYKRFLVLDGPDYERDPRSQSLMSTRSASMLLSTMKVEGKTLLDYITAGKYEEIAPEVALRKLQEIAEKDAKTVVRRIMEQGGKPYVPLEDMIDSQREDFFKRLDWSKLSLPDQQALLHQLTTTSFKGHLVLNNCQGLTKSLVQKLPWENIHEVTIIIETAAPIEVIESLRGIPEGNEVRLKFKNVKILTDDFLDELVKRYKVTLLKLENCPQIKDPELRQKSPNLVWKEMSKLGIDIQKKIRNVLINNQTKLDLSHNNIETAEIIAWMSVLKDTQLTTLNLDNNNIGEAGAKALAEGLRGSQITTLNLGNNIIGEAGAKALASVLKDTRLTTLHLHRNHIGEAGVQALASVLKGTRLTTLGLGLNKIQYAGAIALASVLKDTQLTTLILWDNSIGDEGVVDLAAGLSGSQINTLSLECNEIGDAGVQALAAGLKDTQLTTLNLGNNSIGNAGAQALASVLKDTRLTILNLERNRFGDAGTQALAAGLSGSQINTLSLEYNEIGDAGVQALASVLKDTRLTTLNLGNNKIGKAGAQALAFVLKDTQLTILEFEYNNIQYEGAIALAEGLRGSQITTFSLKNTSSKEYKKIGDVMVRQVAASALVVAQALASVLKDTQLTTLDLEGEMIGDAGAQALASVLKDTQLTTLNLGNNSIGNAGAQALASVLKDTQLTTLNLENNKIGDEGVQALARVLEDTQLTTLNLRRNDIEDEGVVALSLLLKDTQLTTLDLADNHIGNGGVQALALVLKDTQLTTLNLENNKIGEAGAKVLALFLKGTQLTTFSLKHNKIEDAGAQALASVLKDTQLTSLDLHDNLLVENSTLDKIAQILDQNRNRLGTVEPKAFLDPSSDGPNNSVQRSTEVEALSPPSLTVSPQRTAIQIASHLLLNPEVDYREVLDLLRPQLSTSSEAFDLCLQKVAPHYPKSYLFLAESVEPMDHKLIYLQKALERGERGGLSMLEELYAHTRNLAVLLDLASVYKEGITTPKDLQRVRILYEQGMEHHNSAECRYQLARLCIEQDNGVSKETEFLLQQAMAQGHAESHVLWRTLQSNQEAHVMPEELLEGKEKEQLSEARSIRRALTQQVRKGSSDPALMKTLSAEQKRGLEFILQEYKAREELIEKQIVKTQKDLEDLSRGHPHYKRLQQTLMKLEQDFEGVQKSKQQDLEHVVLQEKGHYDSLTISRQNIFYEKLFAELRDQLDILRLTEDGLIDKKESLKEKSVKAVLKCILNHAGELAFDLVPIPGSALVGKVIKGAAAAAWEAAHEKAISQIEKRLFTHKSNVGISLGVISAYYTYRLQDLVPLLTEESQTKLAHLLSVNFIDFITEKKPENMEDASALLIQSFYHQKETLGGKINKLFGWDKVSTIYQETLQMKDIFTSPTLITSDGAEWRAQGNERLMIHGQSVYYKVPLLEIINLQNKGRTLDQVAAPYLSLLQREIILPQDSETYLKDALQFISHLKPVTAKAAA